VSPGPLPGELGRAEVGAAVVIAVVGDLTAQDVDAVVNAANEQLRHGGGVAAALARAGGRQVQKESSAWVRANGEVGPGRAAVTTAGRMPARWIVHVVGPRHRQGQDNEGLLRQAVHAALDAGRDAGATSIALPAISAGIFGYPPAEASRVIAEEARSWLGGARGGIAEVRLVGYDEGAARLFADAL
jgi:O-acetyl-ADP-ribose deacetylase